MRIFLALALLTTTCLASTNTLILTWNQPPGYVSTLYYSTNLAGVWCPISTNAPPYTTVQTNPIAFFWVNVVPPQVLYNFTGSGDPISLGISAPTGSIWYDTNTLALWLKSADGTNGWQDLIGP